MASPAFIEISGKRIPWRDLLEIRREQRKADTAPVARSAGIWAPALGRCRLCRQVAELGAAFLGRPRRHARAA